MEDTFKKEIIDTESNYIISYWHNGVRQKKVNEDKPAYVDWLNEPNTPEVIEFIPPPEKTLPTFEENKATRINQVDAKTFELLEVGEEYPIGSIKRFALAQENLIDYIGIHAMNKDGLIPPMFPIRYSDGSKYLLIDSADVDSFFLVMSARVSTLRVEGWELKDILKNTSTQQELDNNPDTRV